MALLLGRSPRSARPHVSLPVSHTPCNTTRDPPAHQRPHRPEVAGAGQGPDRHEQRVHRQVDAQVLVEVALRRAPAGRPADASRSLERRGAEAPPRRARSSSSMSRRPDGRMPPQLRRPRPRARPPTPSSRKNCPWKPNGTCCGSLGARELLPRAARRARAGTSGRSRVEHHRERDPVVLGVPSGVAHEDRLARVAAGLVPQLERAVAHVDLREHVRTSRRGRCALIAVRVAVRPARCGGRSRCAAARTACR